MKDRKGLTLIEVVLSIAILGIISLAFLLSMTTHFTFLNKTKDISQDAFLAQREMEKEIDFVKDKIRKKELTLKKKTILNDLGGINVNYYEIEKEYYDREYYTLVSDVKPEIYDPVKLKNINIKIEHNTKIVPYGYLSGDFKVEGSFSNKDEHKWDHLLNVIEWYVSSEDYIMPIPDESTLDDDIYYYPIFPKDYVIVDNNTIYNFGSHKVDFEKLENYSGRHIVFTATPGAKSGRIGEQMVSRPVFISGLPITENLIMHFDAGFINPLDTDQVDANNKVKKWFDLSSIYGNENPNEYLIQNDSNMQPQLKKTEKDKEFRGQYVHFNNTEILSINDNSNFNKELYLIAFARNRVKAEDSIFMKNGINEFNVPKDTEENQNDWKLVVQLFNSENQPYNIGGSNVDIAEIVIYDQNLNEDELEKLNIYFNRKYKQ